MVLLFVPGPHRETISIDEMAFIQDSFQEHIDINYIYNNPIHFGYGCIYDMDEYLCELKWLLEHKDQGIGIEVMGGIHKDPLGHTSGLIGQYTLLVQDTYIRFRVMMDCNSNLKVFSPYGQVYHWLVDWPYLVISTLQ